MLTSFGSVDVHQPLKWVVMLAPLGFVFFLSFAHQVDERRRRADRLLGVCGADGPSLSSIFLVYTGESITQHVLHHRRHLRRA